MKNMIITLGNCGTQIGKEIANSPLLGEGTVSLYAIDSQTSSIDLNMVNRINFIPIISDEKNGSGRNRERGAAMYKYHEEGGAFDKMYDEAANSKTPVLVITSAAGGTGSGACVPACKALIDRGIQVIPIIVCPNMSDPDAYHLNANDLMLELAEIGIETYSIFRNQKNGADYSPVNKEVVRLIEIIFGKRYDKTTKDSIDDSDLDVVLSMPGRFMAVTSTANDVDTLRKELTRKVLNGFQPAWTMDDANNSTFVTALSLTSTYADVDYGDVFADINSRIVNRYDEYRNICNDDNNGELTATIIIAGLPRGEMKIIESEFKESSGIGSGMNKSLRPSFMNRKKANIVTSEKDGTKATRKFNWK